MLSSFCVLTLASATLAGAWSWDKRIDIIATLLTLLIIWMVLLLRFGRMSNLALALLMSAALTLSLWPNFVLSIAIRSPPKASSIASQNGLFKRVNIPSKNDLECARVWESECFRKSFIFFGTAFEFSLEDAEHYLDSQLQASQAGLLASASRIVSACIWWRFGIKGLQATHCMGMANIAYLLIMKAITRLALAFALSAPSTSPVLALIVSSVVYTSMVYRDLFSSDIQAILLFF